MIQLLWKTVWRFLKKLGIKLPYDPTVPLLGIYPKKTIIEKDTCTPMFIVALFTIVRTWKKPRCPLNGKETVAHICNGTLQFSSVQSLSRVQIFMTPWTAAH